MIWAAISVHGLSSLVAIQGYLSAANCIPILQQNDRRNIWPKASPR
jgi:hypothetical protein